MGGIMDFAMLAIMIGGGAFVWINKDVLLGGLGPGTGTDPCLNNPDDPGCSGTGNGGGDPAACKDLYNGKCTTECSGGGGTKCDACKEACGEGDGGSSGGGSSDCKRWCSERNCSKYEDNCSAGCSACKGGGGSSGGSSCSSNSDCPTCSGNSSRKCSNGKCGCVDTGGDVSCSSKCSKSGLKVIKESPCQCGQCRVSSDCKTCSGSSYRKCNSSHKCECVSGGSGTTSNPCGGKKGNTCGALGWTWQNKGSSCVCASLGIARFDDVVYPIQVAVGARFPY